MASQSDEHGVVDSVFLDGKAAAATRLLKTFLE